MRRATQLEMETYFLDSDEMKKMSTTKAFQKFIGVY